MPSAAHRNYPRQFGGGIFHILRVLRGKQCVKDFRYVALGPSTRSAALRMATVIGCPTSPSEDTCFFYDCPLYGTSAAMVSSQLCAWPRSG